MATLAAQDLVIDIPGRDDGRPLTFTLQPGQVWGVLGPNGAGKTTLLHTLAGLRSPRRGSVLLNGEKLQRLRRRQIAQQLAVVFQERQDGFPATVLETTMIGRHPFLAPWDVETGEDLQLARDALARLQLQGLEQRLVSTLSGGERQRLAIATALAQTPQLWLADEPSNHLDLRHQVAVMELICEQAAAGCAALLCLHDINLAARWCSHLLLLYPNGEACWGEAPAMLELAALERLYGQSLRTAEIDGARFFVPAANAGTP